MKQRLAVSISVGLFLLVGIGILLGGFFHMHRGSSGAWAAHVFGGRVTSITATKFSVSDIHGTQRTFLMTGETVVRKGKDSVLMSALTQGAFVMVNIAPTSEGKEVAREIHILSTTPRGDRFATSTP